MEKQNIRKPLNLVHFRQLFSQQAVFKERDIFDMWIREKQGKAFRRTLFLYELENDSLIEYIPIMLKIIERDDNKVAIMSLSGDPLGEPDADLVRQKTKQVVQSNIRHVVFDMTGVKHINSAGLGGLVSAMITLSKVGGTVQFTNVREAVQMVFKITRLSELFVVFPSVDEALKQWDSVIS